MAHLVCQASHWSRLSGWTDTWPGFRTGRQTRLPPGFVSWDRYRAFSAVATELGLMQLVFALGIDGVGCLSFALPGIGEAADLLWAPVSAVAVTPQLLALSPPQLVLLAHSLLQLYVFRCIMRMARHRLQFSTSLRKRCPSQILSPALPCHGPTTIGPSL